MAITRARYFDQQFLREADFTIEQKYHLDMRRRLNRALHTFGIAEGLEVAKSGNKTVTVRPGTAIDRDGREMIVETERVIDLPVLPAGATVFITIAYQEQDTAPSTAGVPGNTRVTEQAIVGPVTAPPPIDGTVVRLASFTLDATGNVPGNPNDTFDGGVRQTISPKGGFGLSLDGVSNPGGNVDLFPGPGIAIVPDQPNRRITIANQGLMSVDGVSNPGGNVDLVAPPGQAIVITPDDANNRITIGESHSTLTNNPHNVTAAQTGALVSVDGVSNPGGNVDLVAPPGQAVVIEPDDTNNRITIRETHSAATGNVHNLTAANLQTIGVLLANDYDLRRRALQTVQFDQGNASGAIKTINVGFQPRMVLVVGALQIIGPRVYGGGVSAFADLGTTLIQQCFGPIIVRRSITDWNCSAFPGSGIFRAFFSNSEPVEGEELVVAISSVSTTGLTATFTRTVSGGAPVPRFIINLSLLCLG